MKLSNITYEVATDATDKPVIVGKTPTIQILETKNIEGKDIHFLQKAAIDESNSIALCAWVKGGQVEFVRWWYNEKRNSLFWGHYFMSYENALDDYYETIEKELRKLGENS